MSGLFSWGTKATTATPSSSTPSPSPDSPSPSSLLSSFSLSFKALSWDKAKGAADAGKDAFKTLPGWPPLFTVLGQLCQAERQYVELTFLQPKGFLRKDNSLKSSYDSLRQELTRLRQSASGSPDALLTESVRLARAFVSARLMLIEFYTLALAEAIGAKTFVDWKSWDAKLQTIMAVFQNETWPECLEPFKMPLELETGVLQGNLAALALIDIGQVNEAMPQIQMSKCHHNLWTGLLENADSSRKTSFTSSFLRSSASPLLYQWLTRLKDEVKAKFGLYFHKEFVGFASFKKERAKQTTDYAAKLEAFQKKFDAFCVSLIFDGTAIPDFKGIKTLLKPDALFGAEAEPTPRGLDLYPSVFEAPPESADRLREEFLPSIVSLMDQLKPELERGERPVQFTDSMRCGVSYFLHRVDPHMTLVVVFDPPGPASNDVVISFCQEVSDQLRMIPLLASLRPKK